MLKKILNNLGLILFGAVIGTGLLAGATAITNTETTDTIGTFRTNTNGNLYNLNNDKIEVVTSTYAESRVIFWGTSVTSTLGSSALTFNSSTKRLSVDGVALSTSTKVSGPSVSVDNEVARFDGTGGATIQGSSAFLITDAGTVSSGTWNGTVIGLTFGGTGATTADSARLALVLSSSSNVTFNNATSSNHLQISGQFIGSNQTVNPTTTATNIDFNLGRDVQGITTSNSNITLRNGQAGGRYIVTIQQDGTGSRKVEFVSSTVGVVRVVAANTVDTISTTTANCWDSWGFKFASSTYYLLAHSEGC